ncbi:MAG: MBOAT family protein [Ruminococcaceae bacterium]|nr:MBOAT family protein [Oscillospiraceae bacterium]
MDFSTITFLFFLLPVSVLLYAVVPLKLKNAVLLLVSILFFSWGTPQYLILIVCSIFFNYFTALELEGLLKSEKQRSAKLVLWVSVAINVMLLGFFKYYGFVVNNINALLGTSLEASTLPIPIGLSFYTFTLLSYLFDVYRGKAPVSRNLLNFSLYVTFFPKLVSGPIVQYSDITDQFYDREFSWESFGNGTRLFLIGLGKKVLLANLLGTTFYALTDLPLQEVTFVSAWLGVLCYSLMLYMDFGGYSDMAIGLSQMFGFEIKKNFDYPYLSESITVFWRRWHISLGAWFREYVYFPLGGSRAGKGNTIRNLLIVWCLTGIWHGANWTFIFWGLYHGALLILEKFILARQLDRLPKIARHAITVVLVMIGWVFFFSDSLSMALAWLARMVFFNGLCGSTALYYLGSCWLPMLIAGFACFPLGARIGNNLMRRGNLWKPLSILFFAAILLLSLACLLNDTYSTFLYAQF